MTTIASLILVGCGVLSPATPGTPAAGAPPPLHQSEGLVTLDTDQGTATAELVASPTAITRTGSVMLRLHNRGDLRLVYGRPVQVERWEQNEWVETSESRNTAWTMEALFLAPHESGLDQRWPFLDGYVPPPGWYRFTKTVHADAATGKPDRIVVRTRVEVIED